MYRIPALIVFLTVGLCSSAFAESVGSSLGTPEKMQQTGELLASSTKRCEAIWGAETSKTTAEYCGCINAATMVVAMNSPPADVRADVDLVQKVCLKAFPNVGK